MNLLKTAKRSRMGNELVPIAHADGRVQPGQRRGLERPYIPKSPWMPSLSCGVSSRATDGIRITNEFFSSLDSTYKSLCTGITPVRVGFNPPMSLFGLLLNELLSVLFGAEPGEL